MDIDLLSYDLENVFPVPLMWRQVLGDIALAFNAPNPSVTLRIIERVRFREGIIDISLEQIKDYPASRVSVGPKTWESSIYLWQEGYWDVLVDLHIDDEIDCVSDLILPVRVTNVDGYMWFDPNFIHVP